MSLLMGDQSFSANTVLSHEACAPTSELVGGGEPGARHPGRAIFSCIGDWKLSRVPMNHPIQWRLVMGLAMFHLMLLPLVYFFPTWIGGKNALYHPWSRYTHGSLNSAQYELLVGFWAIARWDWTKRTVLFIAVLVVLSLSHVAIMFSLSNSDDIPVNILKDLLLNTTDVLVAPAFVLAVLLELFRPLWGCLTRENPGNPEQITIFALLRLTTMAALAAALLRISGSFADDLIWFSTDLLLHVALLASCIWMMFAPRYVWIGIAGCLASVVGGVLNTPAEIVSNYGPWHWLPSLVRVYRRIDISRVGFRDRNLREEVRAEYISDLPLPFDISTSPTCPFPST